MKVPALQEATEALAAAEFWVKDASRQIHKERPDRVDALDSIGVAQHRLAAAAKAIRSTMVGERT